MIKCYNKFNSNLQFSKGLSKIFFSLCHRILNDRVISNFPENYIASLEISEKFPLIIFNSRVNVLSSPITL